MHLQLSHAFVALALLPFTLGAIYEDVTQLHDLTYDYVVVGGGTAGLTVASRLSTMPALKILVLEAGVSDVSQATLEVPLLCVSAAPYTQFDWNYTTIAQTGLNNRTIPYPRGFVLGGSSSINYMLYNTGSRDDWDFYAKVTGEPSWSWAAMSRYRLANQRWTLPSSSRNISGEYLPSAHWERGPVDVSLPSYLWPSDQRAVNATQQIPGEFPFQIDMNAGSPIGIGWAQTSIGNGTRASSATSYIHPVIDSRPNLDILLHARATKLVKTNQQGRLPVFRSVNFISKGKAYTVKARKEIILSAGAFNTPQLLLLSGIGAAAELMAANITTIVDLPSVGKNMSDHPISSAIYQTTSNNTWLTHLDPAVVNQEIGFWAATKQGGLSGQVANILGWLRLPSNDSVLRQSGDPSNGPTSAHYEFVFLEDDGLVTSSPPPPGGSILTVGVVVVSPSSRGTVSLNNTSPLDAPIINPNWLTTATDMHIMQYGIEAARRFMKAPAWGEYIVKPYGDFANATTPASLEQYIRNHTGTAWHATGTAAMSARGASHGVVEPDLRVKHTVGLRVVDMSVLPRVPAAHPQAVLYAFALRAASVIAADAGLGLTLLDV